MTRTFLVISNRRSGSTWLTTMLGALHDVFVDYEFKWRPKYPLEPIHLPIEGKPGEITSHLRHMSRGEPIVGSKLTFDPFEVPILDFDELRQAVDPETKIIHLSRNFLEICNSTKRGYYHLPNKSYDHKIGGTLMSALHASAKALSAPPAPPLPCTRRDCYQNLLVLLKNDLMTFEQFSRGFDYLCVDYHQIDARLEHIAHFIGSEAAASEISAIRQEPTTQKLSDETPCDGIEQHSALFEQFERLRVEILPFEASGRDLDACL